MIWKSCVRSMFTVIPSIFSIFMRSAIVYSIKSSGLKYFNVFGPNENHKDDMRSLVNKAFAQIRETGKLQLFKSANPDYADGEFGRDFVYVKDASR